MTSLSTSVENIQPSWWQAFTYHQLDTQLSWEHLKHAGIWEEYCSTSFLPVGSSVFPVGRRIRVFGDVSSAAFGSSSCTKMPHGEEGRRWGHIWLPHFSPAGGFHQAPRAAAADALRNCMWPVSCTFVTLHGSSCWKQQSAVPFSLGWECSMKCEPRVSSICSNAAAGAGVVDVAPAGWHSPTGVLQAPGWQSRTAAHPLAGHTRAGKADSLPFKGLMELFDSRQEDPWSAPLQDEVFDESLHFEASI